MVDAVGSVVQVWGDSYELCGVIAPNQLHTLYGHTDCTNGTSSTSVETAKFYEDDTSLPDLPIPECPAGEVPWHVIIKEATYNPQTMIHEGTDVVVFEWTAPYGANGPSQDVKNCILAAASSSPCIAQPYKLFNGEWVPCSEADCQGYPTPMPSSSETATTVTGTDGETYGCGWGPIIPAPVGYCSAADDPGNGATSTSDDPRLRAVIIHITSTASTIGTDDEAEVAEAAMTCLDLTDAAGLSGNPCADMPIFAPGSDHPDATAVDWDGLVLGHWTGDRIPHPSWFVLHRIATRGPAWYTSRMADPAVVGYGYPLADCFSTGGTTGNDCDEYPYGITYENGSNVSVNNGLSALQAVDLHQNRSEGGQLGGFFTRCGLANDGVSSESAFLVLPMVGAWAPPTFSVCADE